MKTKQIKKSALSRSVCLVLAMVAFVANLFFLTGCEEERLKPTSSMNLKDTVEVIKEYYYTSERTLTAVPSVTDTLVKSTGVFNQISTLYDEKDDLLMNFQPTAYCNVSLSLPGINVKSAEELGVEVSKEYLSSQTPYKSGTTFGKDIVKVFEFTDGQTVTVSYGWRYTGVIVGTDTLATPHVEIGEVTYERAILDQFEAKTELEDPYRMTLAFLASFTSKGVSGREITDKARLKPWYRKVVTSEAVKVESVSYTGRFIGCPYTAYEITEKVKTNLNEFSNTYKVDLALNITAPEKREQPSLDSLFAKVSTGTIAEKKFSETKNSDGFTVRTMTGTYNSVNTGTEKKTSVENMVSFTYQFPVKFESSYGTYQITPLALSFEEYGFTATKISETDEVKTYKTVNSIVGKIGTCTLDVIDEEVTLKIQKDKAPDVVEVDSVYTLSGSGDEYVVEKKVIWSDGSSTTSQYTYTGRHQAAGIDFGEVVTTSLNWKENTLTRVSQTSETEEKKFSSKTKFTIVYTTSNWQSTATNGTQNGTFKFKETSPFVTFTDGDIKKTFPERKYTLTGQGADVAQSYNIVIRNSVSYKAYDYDYTVKAGFGGAPEETLVSEGMLLVKADETGEPVYSTDQTWNGNTAILKVVKTTPHSYAEDEVETFSIDFTVGLTPFTDGKVYAENTNFSATGTNTETNGTAERTPWLIKSSSREYTYTLTNGSVTRNDLKTTLTDGTITFDNGEFSHTFNLRMTVNKSESFGTARQEGNYNVTPHKLTLTATTGSKSVSQTGTTDIYVKREASVTGHTEKTIVYPDGTVDAEVKITKDDGTSQIYKASDSFGSRFAFNFTNASPQEKVVSNVKHNASGSLGNPTTTTAKQGKWTVTTYSYPYNHVLSNGVAADVVNSSYGYKNYQFVYQDDNIGAITVPMATVTMSHKSLNIVEGTTSDGYVKHNANVVVNGSARGTEGSYTKDLSVTHILKIKDESGKEPEPPHFGKPKSFKVTATYDPTSNVTRRAFTFNWESGVTYAVCLYETELPSESDFMFKADSYTGYNSVGYDVNNSNHWQPARGSDDSDAIRWYKSDGALMSAIDKDLSCMVIGWKNIVNGKYALEIPGYTYTINGYNITVKAPSGKTVTFNSHHN